MPAPGYHTFSSPLPSSPKLNPHGPAVSTSVLQRLFPSLLILCGCVLFSGMHTFVRAASTYYDVPSFVIILSRGMFQIPATLSLLFFVRSTLPASISRSSSILLALRGILGTVALIGKFGALARLPVAVATSLFSTTPVFAMTLGWLISGERMTRMDIVSLVISTGASILVGVSGKSGTVDPGDRGDHVLGVLLALMGALATGFVLVIMRRMGERVHFLLSIVSHGFCMSILPVLLTLINRGDVGATWKFFVGPFEDGKSGMYLALMGVAGFSFVAALCQNRGAQLLAAGRVGVLRAFDIPINFVVAFLVLGEFPSELGQVAGCVLIMASTVLMAYNSIRE